MFIAKTAANIGVGLAAGLVGTAAMTASSTIEMKLRHRPPSFASADAAAKLLGVTPNGDTERARFATITHWGYGIAFGAVRGILATLGLSALAATAVNGALLWGTEQVALPALKVTPPFTKWGAAEVAIDAGHHLVYVTAASCAYSFLDRRR